jgi:hypothetical protein
MPFTELVTPAATSPCAPEHFPPGKWTCEVVEVSCVHPMFHIRRSDGLTMVQLHQEVARLMSCHPKQLL